MKHSLGHLHLLAVCVLVCGTESSSQALNITDETKIYASDAISDAEFGISVDIDGDVAIVGAFKGRQGIQQTGSAYLYDVNTGEELFQLIAGDEFHGDRFGYSVAISGSTAIVGAPLDDDAGSKSGSAYLFDITTGNLLHKLTATDAAAGDEFGWSVSISGNTAIVGAARNDDAGNESGSAYLFDVNTGDQLFKLTSNDADAEDFFGRAVDISGNTAIIGAFADDDNGSASGSAYVFNTSTGNQLLKIKAEDASRGDWFGYSVSISSDVAVIGSIFDDDIAGNSGAAYLFDTITGNQLHKLKAIDAGTGDEFGWSVTIGNEFVVIGSTQNDDFGVSSGSVYFYDVLSGNELKKLTASDLVQADAFGVSVALDGQNA